MKITATIHCDTGGCDSSAQAEISVQFDHSHRPYLEAEPPSDWRYHPPERQYGDDVPALAYCAKCLAEWAE